MADQYGGGPGSIMGSGGPTGPNRPRVWGCWCLLRALQGVGWEWYGTGGMCNSPELWAAARSSAWSGVMGESPKRKVKGQGVNLKAVHSAQI